MNKVLELGNVFKARECRDHLVQALMLMDMALVMEEQWPEEPEAEEPKAIEPKAKPKRNIPRSKEENRDIEKERKYQEALQKRQIRIIEKRLKQHQKKRTQYNDSE